MTDLAIDATKAIAQLVGAYAWEEISLAWGFQDHLEKLKEKFLDTQALLEDVGSAKHAKKTQLVNRWLDKVKDVAYFADNVMDDYEYEILRRKVELGKKMSCKRVRNFFDRSNNPFVFRFRMTHKVLEILSKFDELDREAKNIGLQQVKLAREATTGAYISYNEDGENSYLYQLRKHAAASASEFVGRAADEEKLIQMLCNPTNADSDLLTTIAIHGIGGLGKTTLARRLYEHEKVDAHFGKKKVWICVSDDFNIERLLKEMLESLTLRICDLSNISAITKKLEEELKGTKFLLVLDDVWNKNQELWDSLKYELHRIGDPLASVMLITTRNVEVARKARAVYQHNLGELSEEQGWIMLKQKALTRELANDESDFESIGRRIVKKCRGIPLAIKAIGGLLQSKKHPSEWESIMASEIWDLPQDDGNSILPSLLLSYNHLPSMHVKQCFAYCAIFPKDSLLDKHTLIALWLAQGFLFESNKSTSSSLMEEKGERYLNVLLNNSLLQEEGEVDKLGEIRWYKMHDLVHDLAAYVSKNYLLALKAEAELENASNVRHLAVNFDMNEAISESSASDEVLICGSLRSLSYRGGVPRWRLVFPLQYLHTLIMDNCRLYEVPPLIEQLIHLRYLDLSNNQFNALPESICKLYQLQTLRLLNCYLLRELPTRFHRLENLRHIQTTQYLFLSRGLRQLTNLQTLPLLKLRDGQGWMIDELELLHQVKGVLHISGLQHVKKKEAAQKAGLGRKDKILELFLDWDKASEGDEESSNANNDEDVLGDLEPHPNIKSLCISGFRGLRFPSWMMTMVVKQGGNLTPLNNLTEVELSQCSRCQQLPSLGQLPNLRILKLLSFEDVECIGDEFYQRSSNINVAQHVNAEDEVIFRALRELRIYGFRRMTTWKPPSLALAATTFPRLETLDITECPQLETVPTFKFQSLSDIRLYSLNGTQSLDFIKYSHGLKSIALLFIDKLVSVPQELLNCSNLQSLTIISCLSLACIPDDAFHGLSSLRELTIFGCLKLKRIPTSLGECSSLEAMYITSCPIEGPIPDLSRLHALWHLELIDVGDLRTSIPQCIPHLRQLRDLQFGSFKDEEEFNHFLIDMKEAVSDKSIVRLPLRSLNLTFISEVKSLPQLLLQFLLHTSLAYLIIVSWPDLQELPEWIGDLSFLEELRLYHCDELKYLPSREAMLRLSRLRLLDILCCPLLKERCVKDDKPEWFKISHIPHITIDYKDVQHL